VRTKLRLAWGGIARVGPVSQGVGHVPHQQVGVNVDRYGGADQANDNNNLGQD
jgi:hypothetical protein